MGIIQENKLILASASPRRIELLERVGLTFQVVPSGVEEAAHPEESPEEHVLRLSAAKAEALARKNPDAWVLGADTIVVIDGRVLGKPADREGAKAMLQTLSGRVHTVFTGFSVLSGGGSRAVSRAISSAVLFKNLSDEEMNWYVRTDEPYDKAGGYAVQGMGAFFIQEIRGSYTNVMGLPLCEVMEVLCEAGAIRFSTNGNNPIG
ncbi:MAG: septum formation inhibitor Maf [Syntrophaceae bacterium]|nr:septum formation inhibitor Maf [Syntrophaceae bacterium]